MTIFKEVKIREIDLNLTNKCNLNCIHCAFSSHSKDPDELDFERLCEFINEALALGLEDVHLTGGEPTLYKKLPELLEYVTKLGVNARLITNGLLLTESKLKKYKGLGLKSIMYSIDGLEEMHNKIRKHPSSFQKAVESIHIAKQLNYNIRVNAVISKNNIHEIMDLIKYMRNLEIDVFSFFLYSPTGREFKEQLECVVEPPAWRKLIQDIKQFIKTENITKPEIVSEKGFLWNDETMDFDSYKGRGGGCFYLSDILDYLILLANGDLYPCALLTDKGIRYGNIYERSLQDIIDNPENIEIYKGFQQQSDLCNNCFNWNRCHASCKAFSFSYYEDWKKSDPRCNKRLKEEIDFIPLCPLHKENLQTGKEGGYSEKVVEEI